MRLDHTRPGLTGVYGLYQYIDEKKRVWSRWPKRLDELRGIN